MNCGSELSWCFGDSLRETVVTVVTVIYWYVPAPIRRLHAECRDLSMLHLNCDPVYWEREQGCSLILHITSLQDPLKDMSVRVHIEICSWRSICCRCALPAMQASWCRSWRRRGDRMLPMQVGPLNMHVPSNDWELCLMRHFLHYSSLSS